MAAPAAVMFVGRAAGTRRGRHAILLTVAGVVIVVLLVLVVFAALLAAIGGSTLGFGSAAGDEVDPPAAGASPASTEALAEIPADYYVLYAEAAAAYGIDWSVLAGVGKVECDHGRSPLDGCGTRGTVNRAGARGPMQFLGSTWRATAGTFDLDVAGPPVPVGSEQNGYATDGNGDGSADPWDPADAIHAAARMLARNGAPADYQSAITAYNPGSADYVPDVLGHAQRYRAGSENGVAAYTGGPGSVPLSDVDCPGGGVTTVHSQLLPVVEALYAQAPHSFCGGGYRSPERQIELRRQHCGSSDYAIYEMPSSECSPPTARPGNSNHERGLAIDLTCDGTLISTQSDPCFQWLAEHGADYSLFNLPSEPWHFSIDAT